MRESRWQKHKFIFAYWDGYDSLMHDKGVSAKESVKALLSIDQSLQELFPKLQSDTGLLILADHGHIDIQVRYLKDYPSLMECFSTLPALEARTIAFYIKDAYYTIFKERFLTYFKDDFCLLTKQEVLDMHLFEYGIEHSRFQSFLGDYIAIAIGSIELLYDNYYQQRGIMLV